MAPRRDGVRGRIPFGASVRIPIEASHLLSREAVKARVALLLALILTLWGCASLPTLRQRGASASDDSLLVACTADAPAVAVGGEVALRASVQDLIGGPVVYEWSFEDGSISGQGPRVTWHAG